MANLIERNGTFYANFYHPGRTPPKKRFSLRTTRRKTARRILTKLEDDYLQGRFDPWRDDFRTYDKDRTEVLTLKRAEARFIRVKKEQGRRPDTIRTYREILRLLTGAVGGSTVLTSISTEKVREVVWAPGIAKATQHKRYGHLRTFFRWCKREQLLVESPLERVRRPDQPDKLPKAVTRDELELICHAVRADYHGKHAKGWVQVGEMVWRIPLFYFAFYTGMRASELGRLRWSDVDFGRSLIIIREQKNRKEQTIPFNSRARQVLVGVDGGEPRDFVFRSPGFCRRERSAKRFTERASESFRSARTMVKIDRPITLHGLRHGFCTMLAEAGKSAVVIKEAARHADISTSMRYVHMANEHLKAELEDVFGND